MYFGSFNPNGIFTTTPGVEFVDVTTWRKYRQNRLPSGSDWIDVGEHKAQFLTAEDVIIIIKSIVIDGQIPAMTTIERKALTTTFPRIVYDTDLDTYFKFHPAPVNDWMPF